MNKQFKINTIQELDSVLNDLIQLTNHHHYFCFEGEMGAGKTTLITQLLKKIGVKDSISSPTYSIINEYHAPNNRLIYHMDLFRLKNEIELMDIGIEDILESKSLCFIEWPEKIINFLPNNYVKVTIEVIQEVRYISVNTI